jgi:hypothetical protein
MVKVKSEAAEYLASVAFDELGLDRMEAVSELVKAIIIIADGDDDILDIAGNQLAEG